VCRALNRQIAESLLADPAIPIAEIAKRLNVSKQTFYRHFPGGRSAGRRETVEHPFGTIKARMGATHFLMKTLPRVASEMALHVLAYNLTRVMNIIGVQPLLAAMRP
jgi:transposase